MYEYYADEFEWMMRADLSVEDLCAIYSEEFSTLYERVPKRKRRAVFLALIDVRHEGSHNVFREQWGQSNLDEVIEFQKRHDRAVFMPVLADLSCLEAWCGTGNAAKTIRRDRALPEHRNMVPLLIQLWPKGQGATFLKPPCC
jgi:hypothetical protein